MHFRGEQKRWRRDRETGWRHVLGLAGDTCRHVSRTPQKQVFTVYLMSIYIYICMYTLMRSFPKTLVPSHQSGPLKTYTEWYQVPKIYGAVGRPTTGVQTPHSLFSQHWCPTKVRRSLLPMKAQCSVSCFYNSTYACHFVCTHTSLTHSTLGNPNGVATLALRKLKRRFVHRAVGQDNFIRTSFAPSGILGPTS